MKIVSTVLGLAAGALALSPRAAAEEANIQLAAADDLPTVMSLETGGSSSLEAELPSVFLAAPYIGVERSTAFRLDARRHLLRDDAEPLTFASQAGYGLAAFHLTVYADPEPGQYAHGGDAALSQAGLKVVDPEAGDDDALCSTLMTCLATLDALSQEPGVVTPIVVVVDARQQPHPEPKLLRVAAALVDKPTEAPTWTEIFSEIATALPDADPERLTIVVAGGEGDAHEASALLGAAADAVMIDGDDARVFHADASASALQEAAMSGALTVVVGAHYTGDGDPALLGPREAASLGAHVVLVTAETARIGTE